MILTENLKLEQFLDIIFGSKISSEQMRHETVQYVRVLETNYNERIKSLQVQMEKLRKHAQTDRLKNVTKETDRRDLEQLFVQCVEEVRKNIVRRRLKNEFNNRRKVTLSRSNEAELEFELSLAKLADLAKGRVKLEEFTSNDRNHLLDLFVNNQRVLLVVHDIIFDDYSSVKHL